MRVGVVIVVGVLGEMKAWCGAAHAQLFLVAPRGSVQMYIFK